MLSRRVPLLVLVGLALGCTKAAVDSKVPVRATSLHIACRGEGRPAVVLEAGLGNDSRVWSAVLPEVARTTQVCAYDRAGMGASNRPAPRPHSNRQMAEELRELLRATEVSEPYVLVGHSMGGANARYFAAESPDAVVGMVLVDAASEQQPSRYWALLPEATLAEFKQGLAGMPEGLDFDTFRDGLENLKTVSPSLGKLPLVVLAHGKPLPNPPGVSAERGEQLETAWRSMQGDLAHLSTNSVYVIVENAGHHIQLDEPQVVVAAINEVVASVREQRALERQAISRY